MSAETSNPDQPAPDPSRTAGLIAGRRTVNRFQAEPPPRELLMEALELARWAPNHHLTEPWRFYLVGERTRERIVELNREIVAARQGDAAGDAKAASWRRIPGWFVVTRANAPSERQAWEDYAACACAIHNIALYLWSGGVGMKWTTGPVTRHQRFYEILGIDPSDETVVGLIWYGYPDEQPQTRRHPVSERLTELP